MARYPHPMVVQSQMLALGTPLPEFSLLDAVSGDTFSSETLRDKPALLMLICNHCPFVVHIKNELPEIASTVLERGVQVLAISSNDTETHRMDGPEHMKADAAEYHYPFPYLFDESQRLAKQLRAVCTPEFYLFAADGKLVYRGRLDDSSPGNGRPVTGSDLLRAVDALVAGEPPVEPQSPAVGCSVKWKAGNEPDYFHE